MSGEIVMQALSKDRAARFATMDALTIEAMRRAESLDTRGGESNPLAVPAPLAERALPASPRPPAHRPSRAIVLGVVVALAGGTILAVMGRRRREESRTVAARPDATASLGCTSNRACTEQHRGEPYACRASDHACVAIASEDCVPSYEPADLTADDTVWLGAMFPLKGAAGDDFGKMNMDGVAFARAEIAQSLTSLGPATAARGVRRIALVECDDSGDAMRAARHLVDDVGVPAVLGFHSGQEVIDVAGGLLIDRGVVAVASTTPNPLVTRLPQPRDEPRLVWRTTYNYDAIAEATASILHDAIEPRDKSGRSTRVSLVRTGSVAGLAFADSFYKHAVFNGKSALENGREYQEIVLDADAAVSPDEAERLLVQAQPSIVVLLVVGQASLGIIEAVEARLPAGARRPVYVVAPGDASELAPFIGASSERRYRAFGVVSSSSSPINARFVIRYNQARPVPVTRSFNPSPSYDAFYLLAYASFALPLSERVTGVALASRIPRLLGPGRSIEVGPTGVYEGFDLLSSGKTIDLEGAASGLDLDPSTGEAPSDSVLECVAVDARGRALPEDVESGVSYNARTRRTEGTLRCP